MAEKEKHKDIPKEQPKPLVQEKPAMDFFPAPEEPREPAIKFSEMFGKIPRHNWAIATYVFAILAVILIIMSLTGRSLTGGAITSISEEQAGEKLIDFVKLRTGGDAELISTNNMGGLYSVMISYQDSQIPLYITKDGKYLVQGVVPLAEESNATQSTPEEIPKSDKPKVELYVMSFCPYGNKAEDTMLSVYNLLKNKIDFKVFYIVSVQNDQVSSLHGQPEVDQNKREACVLSEYGLDKWWAFTTKVNSDCGSDGSCWQVAAEVNGISVSKITSCVSQKGLQLMKDSQTAADAAQASGSPTMLINGIDTSAVYQYGNSEAYKKAICSAFNKEPSECSTVLTSSVGTTTGGSC